MKMKALQKLCSFVYYLNPIVSCNGMRPFLLFIFLLTFGQSLYANEVEQYVKTSDGITYFALISKGSVEERKMQDAFLDRLVQKLKRRDKNIPIYLWTDQFPMFFGKKEWFSTIAFDTLRSPDPGFIEDYFYFRMGAVYRKEITRYSKPPSNKYQLDLPEPIDLGSSYDTKTAPVGLKIYYDYGDNDSATGWDRLFTLVQYAIDHVEEIKEQQKRIVLPYPVALYDTTTSYKSQVSILTIDTNKIQNIPLLHFGFDHTKVNTTNDYGKFIWIGAGVFILLSIIVLTKRKQLTAHWQKQG
jgi:hypothetical protein